MKPESKPEFMAAYKALFDEGLTYHKIGLRLGISRSKAAELGAAFFVQAGEHRNTDHNLRKKGVTK